MLNRRTVCYASGARRAQESAGPCLDCLRASSSSPGRLLRSHVDTSEIAGVVLDPSDGRITGATVTLIDPARGRERTAQTDANGEYRFTLLAPTHYRLTVAQRGFERVIMDDVAALVYGSAPGAATPSRSTASRTTA